jgi:hypothetical protein
LRVEHHEVLSIDATILSPSLAHPTSATIRFQGKLTDHRLRLRFLVGQRENPANDAEYSEYEVVLTGQYSAN